jgi:hypothetical protein
MWNEAINALVARHLTWTDFEVEAKLKNRASEGLARYVEQTLPGDPATPEVPRLRTARN